MNGSLITESVVLSTIMYALLKSPNITGFAEEPMSEAKLRHSKGFAMLVAGGKISNSASENEHVVVELA